LTSNGVHANLSHDHESATDAIEPSTLSEKLELMARERDNLRQEVTALRKSLEDIQGKHQEEVDELHAKLESAEEGRDEADQRHTDLRVRVKEITASLGEKLKSNAVGTMQIRLFGIMLTLDQGGNTTSQCTK
jgi:predicted transcriptional regulator